MIAAIGQLVSVTWTGSYQYNNKPENKPFSSHRFAKSRGWRKVSESCWHTGWGTMIQSTSKTFVWTLQDWLLSALLLLTPLACFEAQDGRALNSDTSELPLSHFLRHKAQCHLSANRLKVSSFSHIFGFQSRNYKKKKEKNGVAF